LTPDEIELSQATRLLRDERLHVLDAAAAPPALVTNVVLLVVHDAARPSEMLVLGVKSEVSLSNAKVMVHSDTVANLLRFNEVVFYEGLYKNPLHNHKRIEQVHN
jgi:hypothetical protein